MSTDTTSKLEGIATLLLNPKPASELKAIIDGRMKKGEKIKKIQSFFGKNMNIKLKKKQAKIFLEIDWDNFTETIRAFAPNMLWN